MIHCTKCGTALSEESKFCMQCGAAVEVIEHKNAKTPPADLQAVASMETADKPPQAEEQAEQEARTEVQAEVPVIEVQTDLEAASEAQADPANEAAEESVPEADEEFEIPIEKVQYCGKCGARLPEGCRFCLICGTKAGQAPEPVPEKVHPMEQVGDYDFFKGIDYQEAVPKPRGKKLLLAAGVVALILIVAAVGVWVWQLLPYVQTAGKSKAQNAIVYVQEGHSLKFRTPTMNKAEEITGTFRAGDTTSSGQLAKSSHDGRYLAYLNKYEGLTDSWMSGKGELYILDLTKNLRPDTPRGEGIHISANVTTNYFFSADDAFVVYLTDNGNLYAYDYLTAWQLDTDVKGVYSVGNSQVLYYKGNEDNLRSDTPRADVYLRSIPLEADDKVRIDADVGGILDWTPAFDKILYTQNRWDVESSSYRQDVVSYDVAMHTHEMISMGVARIVHASAADNAVLYLLPQRAVFRYEDFIDDDLEASDREMTEPDIENYPELAEFYKFYGENSDEEEYTDSIDFEVISAQRELYEEDIAAYEQMQDRTALRERIHASIDRLAGQGPIFYELMQYREGVTKKLADHAYTRDTGTATGIQGDVTKNYATYCVAEPGRMKKLRMSESEAELDSFDAGRQLREQMPFSLYFSYASQPPVKLFISSQKLMPVDLVVTDKVDGIYFTLQETGNPSAKNELYYAAVKSGSVSDALLVDRGIRLEDGGKRFNGKQLYSKDEQNDGSFDLYTLKDGVKERICYDIALGGIVENGGKTLFFYQTYDPSYLTGELYMMVRDKKLVSANVRDFFYRRDNLVYLLCAGTDGTGDLYAYTGDEVVLIDSGVTQVLEFIE